MKSPIENKQKTQALLPADNRSTLDFKEWVDDLHCDETPRFELLYNGKRIYLDLTTILQCLKIAEHSHFTPPIEADWWLDIVRRYPVEIQLDGRIRTKSP